MFGFKRPYVRNAGQKFSPIYLPGENYSFYCNLDRVTNGLGLNSELFLLDINGNQVYDFGLVIPLVVTGGSSGSHFYSDNIVFPYVSDGFYYFQVYDTSKGYELCRTNPIQCSSSCIPFTQYVKFRHNDQLFGVRYDLIPIFYQKFRLPLNQIKAPEIRSERVQYRQSSNGRELRNSKSFRDIVMTLEMYWSNDEDIEALSAINEHFEVYVAGNRLIQLTQIKTEKPSEFSGQSKSTYECIVDNYGLDYLNLENYSDVLFWGGNIFNEINTFVIPT